MKYQIQITDAEGLIFVIQSFVDLAKAQDRFEFIKEAHGVPNQIFNAPRWKSIGLCQVDRFLGAFFDLDDEA